jgi:Tfp pilus assembly protein PilE
MSSIIKKINNRGFTLVEMLVYAAGVVLILGVIISMLYFAYSWYGTIVNTSRSDQVGVTLADRLVDDIRSAQTIENAQSSFGSSNSYLTLTVLVTPSVTMTKYYALQNGRIAYKENSGTLQYLTPADITISGFTLNSLTSAVSKAVRFSFDIVYTTKTGPATTTYSGLGILRNSYD